MLWPDHPLFDLQVLAALHAPWPELHVRCASDPQAEAALGIVEAHLGPLPQAELVDDAGALTLRARVPTLELTAWLPLSRDLSVHGAPFALVQGEPLPRQRAIDAGLLVADTIVSPLATLTRWARVDGEAVRGDEVRRHTPTHPELRALLAELTDAAEGAGVRVAVDAAAAIVRRRDGRVGVELPLDAWAPDHREPAVAALGRVILARAGHRELRLAPSLELVDRVRPTVRAWLLVRHHPALPEGAPTGPPLPPGPLATELQLVGPPALAAPPAVPDGVDVMGDEPRWLADRFVARWRASAPTPGLDALPGAPVGLEERWGDVEDHPHRGPARWLVRYRDALDDRDLLERVTRRPPDERDREVVRWLVDACEAHGIEPDPGSDERWVEPVADTQGRPGLAVHLDDAPLLDPARWRATLDALAAPVDGLGPLATACFGPRRVTLHLWRTDPPAQDAPRAWRLA